MLGKSRKSQPSENNQLPTSTGASNSIVKGTTIEGTIKAESDIRIDGSLIGSLSCKGKVIIGPEGSVEGDIDCYQAVIEGTFKGNLRVAELLNVRETAKIVGDVATDKLLVQSGAIFDVTCSMGGQKLKSLSDSAVAVS